MQNKFVMAITIENFFSILEIIYFSFDGKEKGSAYVAVTGNVFS